MDLQLDSAADQRILSALRAGQHRRAAALLVQSYGRDVCRASRLVASDPESADDLAHACFAAAFSALGAFRATGSPRSWLIGLVVRHICSRPLGPDDATQPAPPLDRIAADRPLARDLAQSRVGQLDRGSRRLLGIFLSSVEDEETLAPLLGLTPAQWHGALVAVLAALAGSGEAVRGWNGERAEQAYPLLLQSLGRLQWRIPESLVRRLEVLAAAL